MIQEESGSFQQKIQTRFPAIILCAGLSVFFMNVGFLSLFFLVPVGYAVMVYGSPWIAFFTVTGFYVLSGVIIRMISNSSILIGMDIFHFIIMFLGFIWIMAGSKLINTVNMRTAYRFILASAASAVVFLVFISGTLNPAFNTFLAETAEIVSSLIFSSAGGDAVRTSSLQQYMTVEAIIDTVKRVMLRGGAIATMSFLFFLNRHISYTFVMLTKRQRKDLGLKCFFAPANSVWILTGSLAVIFLTRLINAEIPEILAWNVFVICAMIFLAQGAGIAIFLLERQSTTFRLIFNVVVILLIISPLSTILIAAILLLGISENWVTFRAPKGDSISTPGL